MGWEPYKLDKVAHDLVFARKDQKVDGEKNVLGQVYKMRTAVAYGLERFWGEQLRLDGEEAAYWKATWDALVKIMGLADITIPNSADRSEQISALWSEDFSINDRKVSIAVLTQLCDCMVWWTQRYKKTERGNGEKAHAK
jgi:hypothetical protein